MARKPNRAGALDPSKVTTAIDLDRQGKQQGYLTIPHSRDDSAWGAVELPITVVANGRGPTILFTAGNHGDEYEGQIALMKLARALKPARVRGRVVILPHLNLPAVRAGRRLSPIDGRNMNRVFPGRRDGSITEVIAHYVHTRLIRIADAVVDIHSGGRTLDIVPSAVAHFLDDPALMRRTLDAMLAFGAPVGMLLRELDAEGMLDTAVESLGKVLVSTELGGAGFATARNVAIADRGVRNILAHFGVTRDRVAPAPTRLLHTPDARSFIIADDSGMMEPLVDLGAEVKEGAAIARVHHFDHVGRAPAVYRARRAGFVWQRHALGLIQKGDCLMVIAADYRPVKVSE